MNWIRYGYRLPWLVLHACVGIVIGLVLLNPLGRRLWPAAEPPQEYLVPWWSRVFLRIFGVSVRVNGDIIDEPALFAANHLSWVDIVVLHSQRQMAFVAKREIRYWPLVGWLASRAGTIYHRRGSPQSLARVSRAMTRELAAGRSVALFPEGRVSDGSRVLPFHGRLFQCAVETGAPVQPVALRFLEWNGTVNTTTPFRSGEPFLRNLLRLMRRPRTIAELTFCEPIETVERRRRDVANISRERIVLVLEGRQGHAALRAKGFDSREASAKPWGNESRRMR